MQRRADAAIEVHPVSTAGAREAFPELPYHVQGSDPNRIARLRLERRMNRFREEIRPMRRIIERAGGRRRRIYRIYKRALG